VREVAEKRKRRVPPAAALAPVAREIEINRGAPTPTCITSRRPLEIGRRLAIIHIFRPGLFSREKRQTDE